MLVLRYERVKFAWLWQSVLAQRYVQVVERVAVVLVILRNIVLGRVGRWFRWCSLFSCCWTCGKPNTTRRSETLNHHRTPTTLGCSKFRTRPELLTTSCSHKNFNFIMISHMVQELSCWQTEQEVKVIWQKAPHGGAHSPVRGHPRGSKVVQLNSWGRGSY